MNATEPRHPGDLAELLHIARRTIDWYRRPISAVLAGIAVMAGLAALSPKPVPTRAIWTAARDLRGGSPLVAADLALRRIPVALVPAGALAAGSAVVGRLLAAPVRRGEPLTDVRLLEPSLLAALGRPGDVAVPVRVSDGAAATALAHPGDVVDVLAAGPLEDSNASVPSIVASGVTVLAVPGRDTATGSDAGLVVVAVTPDQAAALASAAARSRLSLVLRRS